MLPCTGFVEHQVNHVIYRRSVADLVFAERHVRPESLPVSVTWFTIVNHVLIG